MKMDGSTNGQKQTGQMCQANIVTGQKVTTSWASVILTFGSFSGDTNYYQNVSNNTVKILKKGIYIINYTLGISGGKGIQFLSLITTNTITRCITRHVLTENDEEWNVNLITELSPNDLVQFLMNSPTANTGATQAWSQFQIACLSG